MEKGGGEKYKQGAPISGKNKPRRLLIKRGSGKDRNRDQNNSTDEINNSPPFQSKLQSLFAQIENEFQKLYDQNSERKRFFSSLLPFHLIKKVLHNLTGSETSHFPFCQTFVPSQPVELQKKQCGGVRF